MSPELVFTLIIGTQTLVFLGLTLREDALRRSGR
jgi:hypothetical protein